MTKWIHDYAIPADMRNEIAGLMSEVGALLIWITDPQTSEHVQENAGSRMSRERDDYQSGSRLFTRSLRSGYSWSKGLLLSRAAPKAVW